MYRHFERHAPLSSTHKDRTGDRTRAAEPLNELIDVMPPRRLVLNDSAQRVSRLDDEALTGIDLRNGPSQRIKEKRGVLSGYALHGG